MNLLNACFMVVSEIVLKLWIKEKCQNTNVMNGLGSCNLLEIVILGTHFYF